MKMIRAMRVYLILGLAIAINLKSANAQLAKQNLPIEEISQTLREMVIKEDPESKKEFQKELLALEQANNESYNKLAATIYRFLGDTIKFDAIMGQLAEKYPRGLAARTEAKDALFTKENQSIAQKLAAYQQWLLDFPMDSYNDPDDLTVYVQTVSQLAQELISEKKPEQLPALAAPFVNMDEYYPMVNRWAMDLHKAGQVRESLPLLEQAVEALKLEGWNNGYRNFIMESYAKTLLYSNESQLGVDVLKDLLDNAIQVDAGIALTLARGYQQLGRDQDAFETLEDYLINQSAHDAVVEALEQLYYKLNDNNVENYALYKAVLDDRIAEGLKVRYREEMVEKDSPDFELVNMQGETVRLTDYRGKILILDFWATWCQPCIVSFPGMQAAIDKYENDSEVEFLFINTLQNPEEDYQKLVEEFIAENEYSFHVVYDEMKDRSKSTATAFGVTGIPTQIFIDQNGMIRYVSPGGNANVKDLVNEIDTRISLIREATGS